MLIKVLTLIGVAIVTFLFFFFYPAPADRIINIQNYFITVSGIISGIIIAYLATKIFNIKQEREQRQITIEKLSAKLTNFRRVLYYVLKSSNFWIEHQSLRRFKKDFSTLTYDQLHNQGENRSEEVDRYYDFENRKYISDTTADLYLAMEAIYGEVVIEDTSDWVYARNIHFDYTVESLNYMIWPANQIWYYLDGRYHKHTEGQINDQGISTLYRDSLNESIASIDTKFQNKDFDRKLLASVSTEFYTNYIPMLIELTNRNRASLPSAVTNLFWTLVSIFCLGVIFPLFIQCLTICDQLNIILTLSAVGIIVIAFVNLLFDFYKIMNEEVKLM